MMNEKCRIIQRSVQAFESTLEKRLEKVRAGFAQDMCHMDDFVYHGYSLYCLYRVTENAAYGKRAAEILALLGTMSDESRRAHVVHKSIKEGAMSLHDAVMRAGRSYDSPMDGMFRPTTFLLCYRGLQKAGLITPEQTDLCCKALTRSIAGITEYLDWGPINRGMIKALNLLLAAECFPEHEQAAHWYKLGTYMAQESENQWNIEDSQIYIPIWLSRYILYLTHCKKVNPAENQVVRFTLDYIKQLVSPLGVVPDFGDARFMDSTGNYLLCFEMGAKLLQDTTLKGAAEAMWKFMLTHKERFILDETISSCKRIEPIAECLLWEKELTGTGLAFESAEIGTDLIGKKYRLGSWKENQHYLFLNYRDEGDFGVLPRHYIRNSIIVPMEKTHHGQSDENSIIMLQAGEDVLLHDSGYRETDNAQGVLPGNYRADFFHNKMVVRCGQPYEHDMLLAWLANEPNYNPVSTRKIFFRTFDTMDVARTEVRDDKHHAIQNRTIAYLKEWGCYVVCDTMTATVEGDYFASVHYFAEHVKKAAEGFLLQTVNICEDGQKPIYTNKGEHALLVKQCGAQAADIENVIRHYAAQQGLLLNNTLHLLAGQSTAIVTLLIPFAGVQPVDYQVKLIKPNLADAAYEVQIIRGDKTICLFDRLALSYGYTLPQQRPTYNKETAALQGETIQTDATFAFVQEQQGSLHYGIINAVHLEYKGKTLFDVPYAEMKQFDGSIRRLQTAWNVWEANEE